MSLIQDIEKSIEDSLKKLKEVNDQKDLLIYSWPQKWNDKSCGFGSFISNDNMTYMAQTIVIFGPTKDVSVYHDGKFAYYIEYPKECFWKNFALNNLPGSNQIL